MHDGLQNYIDSTFIVLALFDERRVYVKYINAHLKVGAGGLSHYVNIIESIVRFADFSVLSVYSPGQFCVHVDTVRPHVLLDLVFLSRRIRRVPPFLSVHYIL